MGARLTDRLLTFARRQRLETQSLNLNEFVLGLTELCAARSARPSTSPQRWPPTCGRPSPTRARSKAPS